MILIEKHLKYFILRWLGGWASLIDGIVSILSLGIVFISLRYYMTIIILRSKGRKFGEDVDKSVIRIFLGQKKKKEDKSEEH